MKAKVVTRTDNTARFKDLESGDWFLYENFVHIKSDHLSDDQNAIDFDDDMDPVSVKIDGDTPVTPINVTITY